MDRRTRTAPDGDTRVTGSSDSYLGDLARQRRCLSAGTSAAAELAAGAWDGVNRREDDITCFDPYLVALARGGRSSDF